MFQSQQSTVRISASVLIMSLLAQFIKCTLSVILYIIVCSILLKINQSFYLMQYQNTVSVAKHNDTNQKCIEASSPIKKPINLEMKFLERDKMEGKSINLLESATVLQRIADVCVKYKLKTPLIRKHFLYSAQHKSMYCWIRKVGSTSFTKLFADMKGRPPTPNYYREVDILAPRTLKDLHIALNNTNIFKLLVVRHPFQRLVSSFRDRIEDNLKYTAQAWIYAEKIFRLTRPELFHSNTTTGNFRQKVFTRDKRLKIVPTFKEFLEWLLQSSEEDDVHWARYYTHCAVCGMRYNYILKLDDYTYGQINYVFSKFGLDKNKVYFPKLEKARNGYTNYDTTCKYFGNLTQDIILKLYKRYKIDFEMYNYTLNQYINCANKKI